jgi:hypothetical protein
MMLLDDEWYRALRRRIRLVVLLDSAEDAGLVPLSVLRCHTLAYLSNVLAPVWDMPVLDGKVLKKHGGPFYPALQGDLDGLVGLGVVLISKLGYSLDEDQRWRLEGSFRLNRRLGEPILRCISRFEDERRLGAFIQELCYAVSALNDGELDRAMAEDATYGDPIVGVGNVVDFAEWQDLNYSANATRRFERFVPESGQVTVGEKLHFYVRYLRTRLRSEQ